MKRTGLDERQFTKAFSKAEIQASVQKLADLVSADYAGKNLVLVGVLKGVLPFMADFVRALSIDPEIEFVRLVHQARDRTSMGTVTIVKDIQLDLRGKHVLIVEEIIDSGRTLKFLYERLKSAEPASIEIATLFDKPRRRVVEDLPVRYVGIEVGDPFLVGYGLDLEEKCRNLSDIYALKYPN